MQKVVMISGANRGIGLAIAEAAARRGWRLSLGVRSGSKMPVKTALGSPLVYPFEATDAEDAHRWLSATLERFGRLDALVNNAGVFHALSVWGDPREAALDEMLEVNCKALWRLSRLALPALVARQARIVNIVSVSGKWVSEEQEAGYCISKFAAMGASEALRLALRLHRNGALEQRLGLESELAWLRGLAEASDVTAPRPLFPALVHARAIRRGTGRHRWAMALGHAPHLDRRRAGQAAGRADGADLAGGTGGLAAPRGPRWTSSGFSQGMRASCLPPRSLRRSFARTTSCGSRA